MCAHELGHFCLHSDFKNYVFKEENEITNYRIEAEANLFAFELLFPCNGPVKSISLEEIVNLLTQDSRL